MLSLELIAITNNSIYKYVTLVASQRWHDILFFMNGCEMCTIAIKLRHTRWTLKKRLDGVSL